MRINHNLQVLRLLNDSKKLMKKNDHQVTNLVSGLSINKAADDAATKSDRLMIQKEFQQLQFAIDRGPEEALWSGMPVVDMMNPHLARLRGIVFFQVSFELLTVGIVI